MGFALVGPCLSWLCRIHFHLKKQLFKVIPMLDLAFPSLVIENVKICVLELGLLVGMFAFLKINYNVGEAHQ